MNPLAGASSELAEVGQRLAGLVLTNSAQDTLAGELDLQAIGRAAAAWARCRSRSGSASGRDGSVPINVHSVLLDA